MRRVPSRALLLLALLGCEEQRTAPQPSELPALASSETATPSSTALPPSPSASASAPSAAKKKPRRQRGACVLPTPDPPPEAPAGGRATSVASWQDANDECTVPAGFRPWNWSLLRRVHGLRDKVVIFTVDGGHSVPTTHAGLDVLRNYGVVATYFLTTSVLSKTPGGTELVQRIATEGHELANHSVSHPSLTKLSDEQVRAEIVDADAWISNAVGFSPRPFFRAPFLDRDERTERITQRLCYRPVWFTIYTKDDERDVQADDISRAVLCDGERERKIAKGSILMFHASQEETVKAWPVIITGLRERGFRFMTLSEAMLAREKRGSGAH